jgi:5-formyltetrahydrofolate cyclo-ligase/RNAse (barnase) inhibitor barstar
LKSKPELRRELMARRRALTPEEVAAASAVVFEKLRAMDWSEVGSVHVYRSVAEWGELDTSTFVAWLDPRIEVVQPTLSKEQPFPERKFDVILIPALGWDYEGNRLGLGGGWYDRFVAQQLQAQKIGVGYASALVEDGIPVEPWDMKLDRIILGSPRIKTYGIDGQNFSTLEEFFEEISRVLIPGEAWGHNLDAFNDILRGGFGTPDEGFILRWKNHGTSRRNLGYPETVRQLQKHLEGCHPSNRQSIEQELERARRGEGPTVFDWLLEILAIHGEGGREAEDYVRLELA